uniref:Uncharacterized protein n=1 Tax=Sus scrofa TaxID=9823 RepID=A0A4X1TVN0_PIG
MWSLATSKGGEDGGRERLFASVMIHCEPVWPFHQPGCWLHAQDSEKSSYLPVSFCTCREYICMI